MSDAPARRMFSGFTVGTSTPPRWTLTGPDTPDLSTLLVVLLLAKASIEVRVPRSRYVVVGHAEAMKAMVDHVANEPGAREAGFVLEPEDIPSKPWLQSTPIRSADYRRFTELQGHATEINHAIARAVDYKLVPSWAGAGRWTITGSTARQMAWIAAEVLHKPLDASMAALGVTSMMVAREDRDGQPVAMNTVGRVSRTEVTRDPETGDLIRSVTVESDAGPEL